MEFLFFLPALICFIGSFFYFTMEPRDSSTGRALLVSLYGPVVAVLSIYTSFQSGNPRTDEPRTLMFLLCLALPPTLAAASVILFKGPKWIHAFILPTGFCYLQMLAMGLFVYLKARM
jgi:hypothetical protein